MADKKEVSAEEAYERMLESQEGNSENDVQKYQDRRYVGTKETVGFVLWDAAQSFNINSQSSRFITSIVEVDLGLQTIASAINSVWDIVNDIFFATVVDKTRTRWGKFRPYLLFLAIPGAILTMLYWLMPNMFGGRASDDIVKFAFYFGLTIIREGIGTFQSIARTGLMSTITPHPNDRTRLITIANFASGTFGEKLPEQILDVLITLIQNGIVGSTKNLAALYTGIFVGMGCFTTLVSSGASFWFFTKSKERVIQSIKTPSVMQSLKSIINNKPMLLITLSDFLSSFSLGGSKKDYYTDVLHFPAMTIVAGIPAAPISPISYAWVPWMRRNFSSRLLYIFSKYIGDILYVPVFLFGIMGMKKDYSGGMYQKVVPMGIAMALWEVIWTLFYGLKSVIGTELYNEAMDYCEWKNGYRTEAMTSVAKGLAAKVASSVSNVITTAMKKWIGYDTSAFKSGVEQPNKVKFFLFAMYTIIPAVTGSLGVIPMLFYDLTNKKKEVMYAELIERRRVMSNTVASGNEEDIALVAQAQLSVGEKNKNVDL